MPMIHVRVSRADDRVALWEKHPKHPGGEVFLAGSGTEAEVWETPAVMDAIRQGSLERLDAARGRKAADEDAGEGGAPIATVMSDSSAPAKGSTTVKK